MFEYMPWKKTVILKLSRDTVWSIQAGLTLLITKFIESSDAEEAAVYNAIRTLIQAQLDEQEAKGGVETSGTKISQVCLSYDPNKTEETT